MKLPRRSEGSASESDLGILSLPNPREAGTSGRQAVTFQVGSCESSSGNAHPAGITSSGITYSWVLCSCLFSVELKNKTPTDVKMEKKSFPCNWAVLGNPRSWVISAEKWFTVCGWVWTATQRSQAKLAQWPIPHKSSKQDSWLAMTEGEFNKNCVFKCAFGSKLITTVCCSLDCFTGNFPSQLFLVQNFQLFQSFLFGG